MINEKLQKAFNDQINKELYSEYLYLAMKMYFEGQDLQGFVNWFNVQIQEEHAHAIGMIDYLTTRGGLVEFEQIAKPVVEGSNPVEIFEQVLKHEQFVTSCINSLADVAAETNDKAATLFLNWYIREQVEEEDSVSTVLAKLKFIGDDKKALLMYDKDLAARVFNPPVIG